MDDAPSKESLERARKILPELECANENYKEPEYVLAIEFDTIRRERDEAAEKLAEQLSAALGAADKGMEQNARSVGFVCCVNYSYSDFDKHAEDCPRRVVCAALAAWREREGRCGK